MMSGSGRVRMTFVCTIGLVPSCARAAVQDTETCHCIAANGHYAERAIPIAGTTVVSGRITMHSADIGQQWASTPKS
jgi:hypothetical protein